ncbi:MAG: ABC transporter permease [Bacteroidia bacterium]|nr:ABC transporter permease [Bacteroidia bacterium]
MVFRFLLLFRENFRIALRSIRSNLLRTVLTILIIAIGITALVGILTAIDSIKSSLNSQFTNMGANTFTISNRGMRIHIGEHGKRIRYKNITFREAMQFKDEFTFPCTVSIYTRASGTATVKYNTVKTNPNIQVLGVDDLYIQVAGHEVKKGRNFTAQEILMNTNVVILGNELVKNLFALNENPLEKIIAIGNGKYRVIGVLKEKGTSFGGQGDKICLLPLNNVRQYFARPDMSYTISVMPADSKFLELAFNEAEGQFRTIRKLTYKDEDNFEITKSDNLVNMLISDLKYVTIAATIIGIITLLGAAIGLMNIMLVQVSERTREIGTRKAMGAKSKIIKQQFLFEAVLIGQIGGFLGIIFGILSGNAVASFIGSAFIIPWVWIIGGVILCFLVSIASGLLPAIKASRLDPIEALRFE